MSTEKTEIEELYTSSYQRLLTKARQMLKDDADANDAVSDVFARVAEGTLRLPEGHEESYLMATIRNLCIDRIHRLTLRERVERRLTLSNPSMTVIDSERERITEMIDYAERALPKQTWRVFQLRFDEGLRYWEIAERLGISERAVYKHLAKALTKLKEKFNPTGI
jgi:RNA polymerase sigma-70 factor (ECF subfamily)